jgi:hypothetical protein
MSDSATLEHGYRRLLACYPRRFRCENQEEILAVLMACAQDGQTRPSLEAAVDLLKGAVRMRLRPRAPLPRPGGRAGGRAGSPLGRVTLLFLHAEQVLEGWAVST